MTPEISVVTPTYNKADRLPGLVDALAAQTLSRDRFEVIIVDDCSTDDTSEVLDKLEAEGRLDFGRIRTPSNSGGPSRPRNIGWRTSVAPVVAFLDDDCLPEPGWLEGALAALAASPRIGVLQGRTTPPEGVDLKSLDRWHVYRLVTELSPWFEGTNVFFRREALQAVAGFDESICWWGEDTDLGWRVVEAGWDRAFAADAVVVHEVIDRGWRWAAKFGWLDSRVIEVAAKHPQVRREGFWRPWAIHRQGAEFAAAIVGLSLATRWKPAALLALPYMFYRRPPIRRPGTIRIGLQTLAVDSVRLAGHLRGSVSARIFVL
jgi:GT2 family glycosyltransferase